MVEVAVKYEIVTVQLYNLHEEMEEAKAERDRGRLRWRERQGCQAPSPQRPSVRGFALPATAGDNVGLEG
jgi:hypothetical protein